MNEQLLTMHQYVPPIEDGNVIFYYDPRTMTDTSGGGRTFTTNKAAGVVTTDAYKIYDKSTVRLPANNSLFSNVFTNGWDLSNTDLTIEFTNKFDTLASRSAWSNIFSWWDGVNNANGIWLRFANVGVLNESLNFYSNYDANQPQQNVWYSPDVTRDTVWNKQSSWALVIKGNTLSVYHDGRRATFKHPVTGVLTPTITINRAVHMKALKTMIHGFGFTTAAEGLPGYMGPFKITDVAKYQGPTYLLRPY